MKFYRAYWKSINQRARIKHHLTRFTGQAKNEVNTHIQTTLCRHLNSATGCLKIMASIDSLECLIIARLNTILDNYNRGSPLWLAN